MRVIIKSIHVIIVMLILLLTGCDNTFDEAPPLSGVIDGQDWYYKYAKANYVMTESKFTAELYGKGQTEQDPCSIVNTNEAYLSLEVPSQTGNYQIPSDIPVIFGLPGVTNTTFSAISGYMDITAGNSSQVVGYIEAYYDEKNKVSGSFSFSRCN